MLRSDPPFPSGQSYINRFGSGGSGRFGNAFAGFFQQFLNRGLGFVERFAGSGFVFFGKFPHHRSKGSEDPAASDGPVLDAFHIGFRGGGGKGGSRFFGGGFEFFE